MRRSVPRLSRFALNVLRVQSRSLSTEVNKPNVTIFGGNGTLGRHLVNLLAPISNEITIGCRSWEKYNDNKPFANVRAEYGDIRDESAVERLVEGRDHVINLVGPLYESDNTYVEVYVDGTRNVSHAAYRHGVPRLVHVSTAGAQVDHPSEWLDFKFRSEDMAYACYPEVTIVRPSIMFDDDKNTSALINRIKSALVLAPVIPSPRAVSSMAPVHVADVAQGIKQALSSDQHKSSTFVLEGGEQYTLQELLRTLSGKPTFTFSNAFWDMLLGLTQFLPNPTITRELYAAATKSQRLTRHDWEASGDHAVHAVKGFEDLNVKPRGYRG